MEEETNGGTFTVVGVGGDNTDFCNGEFMGYVRVKKHWPWILSKIYPNRSLQSLEIGPSTLLSSIPSAPNTAEILSVIRNGGINQGFNQNFNTNQRNQGINPNFNVNQQNQGFNSNFNSNIQNQGFSQNPSLTPDRRTNLNIPNFQTNSDASINFQPNAGSSMNQNFPINLRFPNSG